jgi:hypothetical protein
MERLGGVTRLVRWHNRKPGSAGLWARSDADVRRLLRVTDPRSVEWPAFGGIRSTSSAALARQGRRESRYASASRPDALR